MKQTILTLLFSLTVLTSFGQTWQNVGSGVNDKVYDLIKFDNKLYAGGRIGVKYWDGMYICNLRTSEGTVSQKISIVK